ncbi:hypothetical protein [Micromonospora sp. 15K316]|uniref:hypothetical protein n=1 Tax=Micromonospora sp. 15K316 TaxID=2530376 RepID=UPI00140531EE|nr:hypothetical protein [Micromonospora sp. 15K316]
MNPPDGGRPWQRPDRADPVIPGPPHGAAVLALLCAVVAPPAWLAVAGGVAALDDPEAPRVAGYLWVATVAAFASLATGALLVVLRRQAPLRRPVTLVAVAVAAVVLTCALGLG